MTGQHWSGNFSGHHFPLDLFKHTVDTGRKALRELQSKQVPAKLVKVAMHRDGKGLPPPLAKTLLSELDQNDWLREKAVEELDEGEGEHWEAAQLFIRRPDGWVGDFEKLALDHERRLGQHELESKQKEVQQLQEKLDTAKKRLKQRDKEIRSLQKQAEKDAVAQFQTKLDQSDQVIGELRSQISHQQEQIQQASQEKSELQKKNESLEHKLEDLAEKHRKRQKNGSTSAEGVTTGWSRSKPERLARELDQMYASLVVQPTSAETEEVVVEDFLLPESVDPGMGLAIDWVRKLPHPTKLVVDGHNVVWKLDPPIDEEGMPDPTVRRRVESELAQLRRVSKSPLTVVVCWDSSKGPQNYRSSDLTVRFDASADDAIVEESDSKQRVVVVSSDREVQFRSGLNGAVALSSEALVDWIQHGSG